MYIFLFHRSLCFPQLLFAPEDLFPSCIKHITCHSPLPPVSGVSTRVKN